MTTERVIVWSFTVLLLVCALAANRAVSGRVSEAETVTAPGWELNDLDGKQVKLSDFKGKVVILDFWATWCVPCRVEIPHFVELQKGYADRGLAVVGSRWTNRDQK